MEERSGVVTARGAPLTLLGKDVGVGDVVSDFTLLGADLKPVTRQDLRGRTVLFNVVPSLDTGLCSLQTKRFNQELSTLPPNVEVITVSADLPFAQARFAMEAKITHRILSDHRDFSFALAFGVGIKEMRLLARSIFVVDPESRVLYREIVPRRLRREGRKKPRLLEGTGVLCIAVETPAGAPRTLRNRISCREP